MKLKRFLSLLLCAALAVSLAACTFSTPANVLAIDGEDIPAGLYLLCQFQAYQSARSLREDTSVPVLESEIEGKPAETWLYDETVESLRRYLWIDRTFSASGLALTPEQEASVDAAVEQVWAMNGALLEKNGIGLETYRRAVTLSEKYSALLDAYVNSDEGKISEQDAKAYMQEKYVRVQILTLPTSDADYNALSDEDTAKITARAKELAEALNKGGTMDELCEDALQDVFAVCGREYTDTSIDSFRNTTFLSMESTGYDEAFLQSLFDLEEGKAVFYDGAGLPMVYYKIAPFESDADFRDNYHETISEEIASNRFIEDMNATFAGYEVTQLGNAVATYSPKKIKEA